MSPNVAAPFPGNASRTIRLDVLPFGKAISRAVFKPPELAWMDAEIQRIAGNTDLWIPALMAHLEAHRVMVLDIGKLARGSVGFLGTRRGYPLRAEFVARWNVFETLWQHYLAHKSELGAQLSRHPYEAEVLRNSKYFGAGISGIQVEFSRATDPERLGDTRECPYCAEVIKAKAIVCRYCGRELSA